MFDRRYDEPECGSVKAIDGEGAYRRLIANTDAQRRNPDAPTAS